MKNQFLLLSLIAFVLFSCDKEDDSPSIFLEGSYESVYPATAEEPKAGTVMTFSKNGDLLIEHFSLIGGSNDRCITGYSEGTYTLRGEDFTETITASFGPGPAGFDETKGCTPKSQFVNNFDPNNAVASGKLILDDSKGAYSVGFACNDLGDSMNICLGPQTYTKVN